MIYNNWGQGPERCHLAISPKGSLNHFYVSKNGRWERRYIGDNWIYLQADTSRANNEFYTVKGDPWLPRYMLPGQTHTRNENTTLYYLDSCKTFGNGGMRSDIRFIGQDSNLTLELGFQVIELQWIVNGLVEEKYFYGKNVGLVAWENKSGLKSKFKEFVPSHEQPNEIKWSCTVLDETVPSNIPPGPVDPPQAAPHQAAWDKTVEMQITGQGGIRLNKDAGIQQEITKHNSMYGLNLQKVTDEVIIDGYTFMAAESLTGACPRRVYVWKAGIPIYYYTDPKA